MCVKPQFEINQHIVYFRPVYVCYEHCHHPGGYPSGTGGPDESSRHLRLLVRHDSECTPPPLKIVYRH